MIGACGGMLILQNSRVHYEFTAANHWMKIRSTISVGITFSQCYGEDAIVPLECLSTHIEITLVRIEVEEIMTEAPHSVLRKTVSSKYQNTHEWILLQTMEEQSVL